MLKPRDAGRTSVTGVGAKLGETSHVVDQPASRSRARPAYPGAILLLLSLAATLARYYPLTANYFFGDDFLNLFHIVDDQPLRYLVTPNGGHVLLARNAMFSVTWLLAGTDPRPYFWSVLLTHLVNVALLFGVVRVMTGSALLASFGAALWGTSILNEGTLGWYAVYGHALVGTTVLTILYQAARAVERGTPLTRGQRSLWYALALIASSCFGTGTAIAFVLPLALWLLLPPGVRGPRVPLLSLVATVPAVYAAQIWIYRQLAGNDPVTPAVLALMLTAGQAIVVFGVNLIAFGLTRLLAGPFPVDEPFVWYLVLLGFVLLAGLAMRAADTTGRRRLLGCTVLVLATYGIVALGRGALVAIMLRSTVDAVRLSPRYQYVGQLLLTLPLCLVLAQLTASRPVPGRGLLLATVGGVMLVGHLLWTEPIDHHDDSRGGVAEVVSAIDTAVAKAPPGGTVRIENWGFKHLPLPGTLFPGLAAVFTIFYPDDVVDGRRVYFVERDASVIAAFQHGRRTRSLLVPP